jgi:PAS domain S-box-containing protein
MPEPTSSRLRAWVRPELTVLLDELFDGVYIVDRKRTIVFWNQGAERISGYPRSAVLGVDCAHGPLRHEDEEGCRLCEGRCPAHDAMEANQARTAVVYLHAADGQRLPVEAHIRPLQDGEGKVIGAIEVFHDIRHWKEMERLSREKDLLMGVLAHDLRNPLTIILTFARLLQRQVDPSQLDLVDPIVRKARYAFELVDSLLDAKALESETVTLKLAETDPAPILRESLINYSRIAAEKRVRLELALGGTLPRLQLDPVRFEEVLNNLVSNAVKYSHPDTRVEIGAVLREGGVEITVRDQGPGIPEAEHGRLFEPFSQAGPRPTGGESSHGLGLFIVKKLTALMGGTVALDSRPGHGTSITLRFPVPPPGPSA